MELERCSSTPRSALCLSECIISEHFRDRVLHMMPWADGLGRACHSEAKAGDMQRDHHLLILDARLQSRKSVRGAAMIATGQRCLLGEY